MPAGRRQLERGCRGRVGRSALMQAGTAVHAEPLFGTDLGPADVALHAPSLSEHVAGRVARCGGDGRRRQTLTTVTGRFAPSPTGDLHVGNLRTALVAWLLARVGGGRFVLRVEDLDRATSSLDHERAQLADLAALGLDWDNDEHGPVWRQSDRFPDVRRGDRPAPPPGAHLRVLLHPSRDPRPRSRRPTPATSRRLPRHVPRPDRTRARRAASDPSAGAALPFGPRDDRRRRHHRRSPTPARSTTSCCGATTASPPTTSPWSSTTPPRRSTRWCAGTTCWRSPAARSPCNGRSTCRPRGTATCRWCSDRRANASPNATER